ncbi:MAG: PIN domain-containing protein [Thermomicrobiales bacterium]|nr:PIN domain-containing protein [Thermomicrobiales bacterium]
MARLIDTSVIIAMERKRIPASVLASALQGEAIGIASITASELLVGYYRASGPRQEQERLEFIEIVLGEFPVLPFDLDVARIHAQLTVELKADGRSIGSHDLIIAATAVTHGFEVLTHNLRHFERVPGLKASVPDW